jgi:hypothetical protein
MRYFGYRPESTYGTEDTSATIRYLNMGKCSLDTPEDPNLEVPTFEETPSRIKRGLYSPSGDLEVALDIYSINEFLKFTLGVETTATKKYLMYAGSSRQLPSFTAYVGKDDGNPNDYEHIFYGCVISKLNISLSDGLATATISIQAQKDGKDNLKDESAITIAESYPIAFYEAQTTMGNSDLTARTTSFEFEFDNGIKAENGQAFGSMFPYKLTSSGKTPTIKTDVFYEGYDMLVKFWGSADGPTCGTEYSTYKIVFTDEENNTLTLDFPKVALATASAPVEGTDEIKQSLELKVLKGSMAKPSGFTPAGTLNTSVVATVVLS